MSKLRNNQSIFCQNVGRFIAYCFAHKIELTFGEAWRPQEMQEVYVLAGKSKTMDSNHIRRLAIDFNFFINGVLTYDKVQLQKLGNFWESLHPANKWGGNYKTFQDTPHLEMLNI